MRELESSLQQFGEYLLKAQLVRKNAAPYVVRWVRQFLGRPATNESSADQVRRFCEDLERSGRYADWQVRQAEEALRIYFVNFLKCRELHRQPASAVLDDEGRTNALAALQQPRARIRPGTIPIELNAATRTGCGGSLTMWRGSRTLSILASRRNRCATF